MKKIIFFTQNRWAFGSVHNGLCKELYKYGLLCNIFDWTREYTSDEINMLGFRKTCYLLLGNGARCNNLGIIQGREAQLIKIVEGTNYKAKGAFKKSVISN